MRERTPQTSDLTLSTMATQPLALRFKRAVPADEARGIVPYRHYRIWTSTEEVGRINLRTASTRLTDSVIGHIGFEIAEAYRGRGFARLACIALIPEVRRYMPTALITCDPDNVASRQTLERLGATFLGQFAVPEEYQHVSPLARDKLHFRWTP